MGFSRRMFGICAALACTVGLAAIPVASAKPGARTQKTRDAGSCVLGNGSGRIKHVIYIQFDNVHLRRDNPNVPSDLEQMPHLLNFLKGNGTVLNKQYTILISHTAGGILSSLTGLYPDRQGVTVSNSYDYYRPDQTPTFTSAFKYWTSPVASDDPLPNMVTDGQKNTPAPWVSYTRDGCDVGNVSVANTVLENNTSDISNVYGAGSPEAAEESTAKGTADFVGISVHCAQAQTSVCKQSAHAKPDLLPDEPGGYNGYSALFGAKYVDPAIANGNAAVNDINGNPITDPSGNPGFPGFDGMSAANTLGYVAQMQEAGIPVTFAYVSDVHDNHAGTGAYGPGEAGYVNALKAYDDAFGKFFARLAADGINKSNTLFIVTADENDHYAGQQAQGCDGVHTPCVYNTAPGDPVTRGLQPQHGIFDVTGGAASSSDPSSWNGPSTWPPAGVNGPLVGEVGYNMKWLLGQTVAGSGYDISFDSAPSFYINSQPQAEDSSGNVVVNPTLRAFEQKAANLKAFDPYIDSTKLTPVARYLVDEPTLEALHMINADPARNMSFTMFSQPDYFFQTSSPCPKGQGCVNDAFAWIHGDYDPNDVGQTWLGVVGPGVRDGGIDNRTWTDHTDIVPTMDALTGLHPDYTPDGRAITQILSQRGAKGDGGRSSQLLGALYKQLDAPYGAFNHWLIVASTNGIKSDDTTYLATEKAIQSLAGQRDAVALQMRGLLYGTGHGHSEQLIRQALALLGRAWALSRS
ncbi:MAG TPA: alkaline phosphatase family protein [Solirubrobacteraceae bacterium]|nr:alkaline phosphatase family protein [Solirubrobacteraceae bacterium]